MDVAHLVARRDELQLQYVDANNHARELAGAVAAYDEMVATLEAEEAAVEVSDGSVDHTREEG